MFLRCLCWLVKTLVYWGFWWVILVKISQCHRFDWRMSLCCCRDILSFLDSLHGYQSDQTGDYAFQLIHILENQHLVNWLFKDSWALVALEKANYMGQRWLLLDQLHYCCWQWRCSYYLNWIDNWENWIPPRSWFYSCILQQSNLKCLMISDFPCVNQIIPFL